MKRFLVVTSFLLIVSVTAACVPGSPEETSELVLPTSVSPVADEIGLPTPTLPLPTPAVTVLAQSPTPVPTQIPVEQVVFVEEDDVLNIRSGPGVQFGIVGELAPDETGIEITGSGEFVAGSTWVPIIAGDRKGWVNGRFLSDVVDDQLFCQDEGVYDLLGDLKSAIENQDGESLAKLVHPERGLRIRHAWWNPEVFLTGGELEELFISSTSYDWGIEDGSGLPISGPFKQEILPILQEDFLQSVDMACNEILQGGTAGIIRLPFDYQLIDFYSFYRPGTEENSELNWGSWVIGVEQWQGDYYISFLVHFAWEI